MILGVTFSTTRFSMLRQTWANFDRNKSDPHPVAMTQLDVDYAGGLVLLLDWKRKIVFRKECVPQATGMISLGEDLLICAFNKVVFLDRDLLPKRVISAECFNNLHGLCQWDNGFAVASSGLDSIVYMRDEGIDAVWCALDHGFNRMPSGCVRHLDLAQNHCFVYYPTMTHTTHVNSLLWNALRGEIYATFFHQGCVVVIEKRTGDVRVVYEGLKAPHSITRLSDGRLMVADSGNNRILVWSERGQPSLIDGRGCDWIQDAKETPYHTIIVADSNNSRLLELSFSGDIIDAWEFDKEWKVYEATVVDD